MGRAMLAALPEKERDWLLRHIARREGRRWPKMRLGIERARKEFAIRGFTLSVGEWQTDVTAVGVPLDSGRWIRASSLSIAARRRFISAAVDLSATLARVW